MNERRPIRAAQALNVAAEQPANGTVEGAKNSRELIEEVRQALIAARLFDPIIAEYGANYSKLICPQKNDSSLPRTLVVIHADMTVTVRHPRDCASDTLIRPTIYEPADYEGNDIGQFVVERIHKLHNNDRRPASSYAGRSLSF